MLKFVFLLVMLSANAFAQEVPVKAFNQTMLVTVFNIQKSENSSWNSEVFKALVEGSDLVLVQESVDKFPGYSFDGEAYIDYFYKSWGNSSYNTGVGSLTRVPFDSAKRLVSPDAEPIAGTPKVSSLEKYSIKGLKQQMLVANTHAINFTGLSAFRRQISAVAAEIENHQGPVVWGGDFNTWSGRRKQYLDSVMSKLGLKEVVFNKRSELFLVLDHVYVRGADVRYAEQLQLGISDHEPLQFSLEFVTPN